MCIVENRQRGTPCLMIRKNPHIKMTRQADNEHLSNLLIYDGNMVHFSLFPLFIISFFSFSLFSQYRTLFFIRKMLHRQLIMVTLQVSTMSAWIRPAAQAFLYHIYITPWTYKLPFHFTLTTSIYKRA